MSGLEMLPPDQRAVLQLILAQGRGYAELAQLLKIDASAVRSRAHAGLDALAAAGVTPDGDQRARIADYLLGQQDDGERLVTLVSLGESATAFQWASGLRQQLTPLARDPLPEVPEPVSSNGTALPATPAPVVATPSPPAAPAAPVPPSPPADAQSAPGPRPSRLGGAILLGAAAVIAIVLAIVLIGGDGDDAPSSPAASTPAQTSTQPSTTGDQAAGTAVAQVNLLATPAGGQAAGIGIVQRSGDTQAIAIQAEKLPANGAQDIYAAWLSGPPGTKLLGFVPRQVKANGTFTVSAELPANARQYDTVLIARESAAGGKVPSQPGETIMRGTLRLPS